MESWDELDGAALVNLGDAGFAEFIKYKEELKRDGHDWRGDAYEILTGYIWDESEDWSD